MTEKTTSLTDLPLDVLVLVFPYLDARSFLALCSTCKALQQPSIRLDSAYWSHTTRSTFRVRNQPVVQSDGLRWQKMFRRLLTQSRVFTWGSNTHHCLGHTHPEQNRQMNPMMRRRWNSRNGNVSFPTEMDHARELGIIADMQCGGWSTTLLTSKGNLYMTGVLDGMSIPRDVSTDRPEPLKYPPGFPQSIDRYEPSVATQQFSSGRSHVLALADSGRIWSWYATHLPALHVKFLHFDINETSSQSKEQVSETDVTGQIGRVRQVVAGWGHSSAYIWGTGIILWSPVKRPRNDDNSDTMLVIDSGVVPKTSFQRAMHSSRQTEEVKNLGDEVGMITSYIVLEHFVVFVTDIGKAFAAKIGDESTTTDIMELYRLRNDPDRPSDVQGSFRHFAVFKNGEVLITDQGYLDRCWDSRFDNPKQTGIQGLQRVPALQNNDVISVAFGDYHYHALHSNGRITSYGKEPQGSGALGLGVEDSPQAVVRGMQRVGFDNEGQLLPETYTTGRQVWFEKDKREWMRFMARGGKDPFEAKERKLLAARDIRITAEVSEWFEQESRDWDKCPELQAADEDGLGAYFALSVSAAGWHSGALVLVNEDLARNLHKCCLENEVQETTENTQDSPKAGSVESSLSTSDEPGGSGLSSSLLSSISGWLYRVARQFLGLPPSTDPQGQALIAQEEESESKEVRYKWMNDSWPRLKLSDGQEMPGQVPFSEWKYGMPNFKLDFEA